MPTLKGATVTAEIVKHGLGDKIVVQSLKADGAEITSPMVGTFYLKPAPDAPNFVDVGSVVSIGQTLCIIEAMKVMNEIKAERAGTICAFVAEDSTPVQYGDVLFRIK